MAHIFITGSSDGLGLMAAHTLMNMGHRVVLHAKNEKRKKELSEKINGEATILIADLSDLEQSQQLANEVNKLEPFDAIIHNAGVYNAASKDIFNINVLAPYVLSCLIKKPKRIIYVSSDMHLGGDTKLHGQQFDINRITYSDSKLQLLMLCKAFAKKWPDVYVNAVHPGWVPTKMGGKGAPDDLQKGYETQVWLATSNEDAAKVSAKYFFHKKESRYRSEADDANLQQRLLSVCKNLSAVDF